MAHIYYHPITKEWTQQEQHAEITFGTNKQVIPYNENRQHPYFRFHVKKTRNRIGPLIGIMTNAKTGKQLNGNLRMFKRIGREVNKRGGIVIVFTETGIQEQAITGYSFIEQENKWLKLKAPLPDIVYNRIADRQLEHDLLTQLKKLNIPFFNPHFFNKWEMYQILMQVPSLQAHLPETVKWNDSESLTYMLRKHGDIYAKPVDGKKGDGIFTISESDQVSSIPKNYILQQRIPLATCQSRMYDYRVLAHFVTGKWLMSGIGVRLAKLGAVTTHVPKGGSILPVGEVDTDDHLLHQLIDKIGKQLQKTVGHVKEMSVDIGKTMAGEYYIFEVNAKPMVFDEPHIRRQGTKHLVDIFEEESGFLL